MSKCQARLFRQSAVPLLMVAMLTAIAACDNAPTDPTLQSTAVSADVAARSAAAATASSVRTEGVALIGASYLDVGGINTVARTVRKYRANQRCVIEFGTTYDESANYAPDVKVEGNRIAQRIMLVLDTVFGASASTANAGPSQCIVLIAGNIHSSNTETKAANVLGQMIRLYVIPELKKRAHYQQKITILMSPSLEDKAGSSWSTLANALASGLKGVDQSWAARMRFVHNPSPGENGKSVFSGEPASVTVSAVLNGKSVDQRIGILRLCNGTIAGCKDGAKGQSQFFISNDGYNVYLPGQEANSTSPNSGSFDDVAAQTIEQYRASLSSLDATDVIWLPWHSWMNRFIQTKEGGLPTYYRPLNVPLPNRPRFDITPVVTTWLAEVMKK